ncbi:cytochrome c [Aureisphaera galaxeae]|uniref:c-type cytochrome n=1 Tax=Aureisphaera galaxeae TaxID=1538023 RepID=UPI00234FFCF5|nr:cytochrome c [Aureisphaera galaxeae]MDC8004808.1 cytochrome c [Aureisphaera galaxeae]
MKSLVTLSLLGVLLLTLGLKAPNDIYEPQATHQTINGDSIFNFGKALFKANCASCHYIGMDKIATAPALGDITKRRERDWLYAYTRNSQEMFRNGDSIAKTLREAGWSPMEPFPSLTDADFDKIYYFVEKRYEMSLNGIPVPIEFEFNPAENEQVQACAHVLSKERHILYACVSKDRFWTFSCASETHDPEDWNKTTLRTLFEMDNSINELSNLIPEYPAFRNNRKSEWDFKLD